MLVIFEKPVFDIPHDAGATWDLLGGNFYTGQEVAEYTQPLLISPCSMAYASHRCSVYTKAKVPPKRGLLGQ